MHKNSEKSVTIYIGFRPFQGEWLERNQTVLNALAWQDMPDLVIKFACWPDEKETIEYAHAHGYDVVVVPWTEHYLFPGRLRSFKLMFEALLADCKTELCGYMNGDIVPGPGVMSWVADNARPRTLYSLPRHNWDFDRALVTPDDFSEALAVSRPEAWTALDLFVFHTEDGCRDMVPLPPFLLTAGSMDSWLVARTTEAGWETRLIPPTDHALLHIEHPASHPFKPGQDMDRRARWAFNCGVFAAATQEMPRSVVADTSLARFVGADSVVAVNDNLADEGRK